MEDFIRIGVADSAELVRVGQGTLESPILALELLLKCLKIGSKGLNPTWVVGGNAFLAADRVNGCSLLRTGFG